MDGVISWTHSKEMKKVMNEGLMRLSPLFKLFIDEWRSKRRMLTISMKKQLKVSSCPMRKIWNNWFVSLFKSTLEQIHRLHLSKCSSPSLICYKTRRLDFNWIISLCTFWRISLRLSQWCLKSENRMNRLFHLCL